MEIRFVTRNVTLDDALKDHMEKKLSKLEKFFDRITNTHIVLSFSRGMHIVEITSTVNGLVMRGEDYSPDPRKAFDKALKNIERQIKRHKSYVKDRTLAKSHHDFSFDIEPIDPELGHEPQVESEPAQIVKTKRFVVGVMTPTEAAMQMDLLGHNFYLFRSDVTGGINVVYRRREGGYGLLEPED